MSVSTPICNFGEKSHEFSLKSTEDKLISLNDVKGENGYLIMFICNHCPYVQAIISFLVNDAKYLEGIGIKSTSHHIGRTYFGYIEYDTLRNSSWTKTIIILYFIKMLDFIL